MKITSTNRRPILALVAGSALLLGGATMPKICFHNAKLLYMAGQVRMAIGDRDGGLRLISSAAQISNGSSAQANIEETTAAKPAQECSTAKQPTMVASSAQSSQKHWFSRRELDPAKLQAVVKLDPIMHGVAFDQVAFEKHMKVVEGEAAEARRDQLRTTMARVRTDLEHRGIPVPPGFGVTAPAPPAAPTTTP